MFNFSPKLLLEVDCLQAVFYSLQTVHFKSLHEALSCLPNLSRYPQGSTRRKTVLFKNRFHSKVRLSNSALFEYQLQIQQRCFVLCKEEFPNSII